LGHKARQLQPSTDRTFGLTRFRNKVIPAVFPDDFLRLARRSAEKAACARNEDLRVRANDKAFWAPLLKELERLRHPK
jgi:hypothetical protein